MNIPSLAAVHERFCKVNGKEYIPENLQKDLAWNCFAVATVLSDLLKENGVKNARAVYGMWSGLCVEKNKTGAYRHGWVVVDRKTIIDPTRWVFDGVEPRMFKAAVNNRPEYDEAMIKFRKQFSRPFPKFDSNQVVKEFKWSQEVKSFFNSLIHQDGSKMSIQQVLWCCNIPYTSYGDLLNEVYTEFEKQGCIAFIPIDFKNYWKSL